MCFSFLKIIVEKAKPIRIKKETLNFNIFLKNNRGKKSKFLKFKASP